MGQSSRRGIAMSCYLVLAAVATAVLSYPTGPPNCDSAPNHSGGKGDEIVLSVQDIGDGAWNVTVSVEHKGLILKADVNGGGEKPGRGYKARSFGSGNHHRHLRCHNHHCSHNHHHCSLIIIITISITSIILLLLIIIIIMAVTIFITMIIIICIMLITGECITHSDRRSKGGKSFFFRSESGEKPSITGVLVTGYSKTYSPLRSSSDLLVQFDQFAVLQELSIE